MKKDTHPEYHTKAEVTCACGNSFTVGSTMKELKVEICSNCHPFYTGKQKLMDTAGRVDRFKRISEQKEKLAKVRKGKKIKKAKAAARKVSKDKKDK